MVRENSHDICGYRPLLVHSLSDCRIISKRLNLNPREQGRGMTELVFKGKEFVWNHHLAVPFRPLVPVADKGIGTPRLDGNLIIKG